MDSSGLKVSWVKNDQKLPSLSQLNKLLSGVAPLGSAPTTAYTSYTGSLTTPPCTEGVKWINFLTPLKISVSQMEIFR